jgi:hypothetical protein
MDLCQSSGRVRWWHCEQVNPAGSSQPQVGHVCSSCRFHIIRCVAIGTAVMMARATVARQGFSRQMVQ